MILKNININKKLQWNEIYVIIVTWARGLVGYDVSLTRRRS